MHIGKYGRKSRKNNPIGLALIAAGAGGLKLVGDASPSSFEHLWNTNELGYSGLAVVLGILGAGALILFGLAVLFGETDG